MNKVIAALAVAILASQPALAEGEALGDATRGAKLGYTCLGCHGIEHYKNAYPKYSVPKLGGQSGLYVAGALNEYAEGARWHPTMRGLAATFNDQDRLDLGAWLAGQARVNPDAAPPGTPPAQAQTCAACHGLNGVGLLPENPTLAGQYADYLVQALRDYRSGKRQHTVMNGLAAPLSDADIRALAAWYAAQPGLVTAKR